VRWAQPFEQVGQVAVFIACLPGFRLERALDLLAGMVSLVELAFYDMA